MSPGKILSIFFYVLVFIQISSFRLLLLQIASKRNRRIRIDFYPFSQFTLKNALLVDWVFERIGVPVIIFHSKLFLSPTVACNLFFTSSFITYRYKE